MNEEETRKFHETLLRIGCRILERENEIDEFIETLPETTSDGKKITFRRYNE
jgi:hypothetical protein